AGHDRVNIGYFGNVYGRGSLKPLLDGLAALPPKDQARLRVHVYTQRPQELIELVTKLGIGDSMRVNHYAPYLDFLAIARQLDLLVVADYLLPSDAAGNPYLVSKWSDYVGAHRPVWLMEEPSSVLSRSDHPAIVLRTPVG